MSYRRPRSGKFYYFYRVTTSAVPELPPGMVVIDRGRRTTTTWDFDGRRVQAERLDRLCPDCLEDFGRCVPIGHRDLCRPDTPLAIPGTFAKRTKHWRREMARAGN